VLAGRRGGNPLVGWLGRLSLSNQATSLCWLRVTPGAGRSRGLLSDRHQFNRLVRSKAVDVVDNPLRLFAFRVSGATGHPTGRFVDSGPRETLSPLLAAVVADGVFGVDGHSVPFQG
jgi:hypothetical protein